MNTLLSFPAARPDWISEASRRQDVKQVSLSGAAKPPKGKLVTPPPPQLGSRRVLFCFVFRFSQLLASVPLFDFSALADKL